MYVFPNPDLARVLHGRSVRVICDNNLIDFGSFLEHTCDFDEILIHVILMKS